MGQDTHASSAVSLTLRFNGYTSSGAITANLNGHTLVYTDVARTGFQDVLNSYSVPTSYLRQGVNQLLLTVAHGDAEISQVELETVFGTAKPPVPDPSTHEMPMAQATTNNFRVDHLAGASPVITLTTGLYDLGGTSTVTYTVDVLTPRPWIGVDPAQGTLLSPALGGGVTPLNIRLDLTGVHTDDEGDVLVLRVNGGPAPQNMPIYIGILVVASGAHTAPVFTPYAPNTTVYNPAALP
jgi:hypothetical protein